MKRLTYILVTIAVNPESYKIETPRILYIGNKEKLRNYHYNALFSLFLTLKTRHQTIFYQPQWNNYVEISSLDLV